MICGLLGSLSTMVSVPVRVPVAVGVKARFKVQEPPLAANFALHPPVTAKSPVVVVLLTVIVLVVDQLVRTRP